MLTLNDHDSYKAEIVSKQTILKCSSYTCCTYIYTDEKHNNYFALLYSYTLFYTVVAHINYIGTYIHNHTTRVEYMCRYHAERERDQKTIPCDFYVISAGGWQFVYIGGNFSNPVSVTIPDGGSPERPSSVFPFFFSLSALINNSDPTLNVVKLIFFPITRILYIESHAWVTSIEITV